MTTRTVKSPNQIIGNHTIQLPASKSISNRALIAAAQCDAIEDIDNLSNADDTQILLKALQRPASTINVGHGGTTFRFLLAHLATSGHKGVLTGSDRLNERPVKPLVEALRYIGADIDYVEQEGFPPLRLKGFKQVKNVVTVPANISSQFISALLLVAPSLPQGLKVFLEGKLISKSYIDMTVSVMNHYGIYPHWQDKTIEVAPAQYARRAFRVEADWSAASYVYALASVYRQASFSIPGLLKNSVQGDAKIAAYSESFFGLSTEYNTEGIICKDNGTRVTAFTGNLINEPDLCPAIAVMCVANAVNGSFNGLESLRIKETDRIAALHRELSHWGYTFEENIANDSVYKYTLKGQFTLPDYTPVIKTYHDHRMAMALSILSKYNLITIEDPMVVTKSFPRFWDRLEELGFDLQ